MILNINSSIIDDRAIICYEKKKGTASATSEVETYPASAPNNELTYSYWQPTALPAIWTLTFNDNEDIDYFAIANHTLIGCMVTLQQGDNWTEIGHTEVITDRRPIIFKFNSITTNKVRIVITGVPLGEVLVGVVFCGKTLFMQRELYGGHSPITMSRSTVKRTNESERGQWLGTTIIRQGLETGYSWNNLEADWVRENFEPFILHARNKPFFIAWRPLTYPNELAYVYAPKDIQPSNSGKANFMSVSMNVKGLGTDE
ncbi:MAG: hypothetical protein LBP40_00360 [Campylobacteraceae bacterium]|jgi:hypothetical protein|nr:hypothetical protein [Campylobacteraceae bacterium]